MPLPMANHKVDLCVVGGGMAGICAALSAARHGAKVVLMHERPVLGGNASSETRVHITGADRHNIIKNLRETGILEELRLENLRRNPNRNFSIWDTILYEKVHFQPNLTLLLNCTCMSADMAGSRIASVTGWQLTTQTHHKVEAKIFADCSGDAILAPLTGAQFRVGREARGEYNEPMAPEEADAKTMGMTCLFFAKRYDTPQKFTPPAWAIKIDKCTDMPYAARGHRWFEVGYWWIELGGEQDSIHDTETIRDELLKITYGVWDHIKNRCPERAIEADNWALDWIQFLPAKRESRRYVGKHVLTQLDVEAEGRFDDRVAFGGWPMDDHPTEGFWSYRAKKESAVFNRAPSPYGIAYRTLYSRNIENLMFAGRCASCTHAAMSSTRVMGTGCSQGQAVGTAAAMAVAKGLTTPDDLLPHVKELQQQLLRDDAYLPWVPQEFSPVNKQARLEASQGDPRPLLDGIHRPVKEDMHAWLSHPGDWVAMTWDAPRKLAAVTLIVDSAMDQLIQMSHHQHNVQPCSPMPVTPRVIRIEGLVDGQWKTLHEISDNYQRLIRLPLEGQFQGVRYTLRQTWGALDSWLYAFYVECDGQHV